MFRVMSEIVKDSDAVLQSRGEVGIVYNKRAKTPKEAIKKAAAQLTIASPEYRSVWADPSTWIAEEIK